MADGHAVTLHVGTPKSGTTTLQNILARNRDLLLEHGHLYPGEKAGHFIEALSLRDSGFRGHRFEAAEGAWDRVVATILDHDGPALLSHEILGGSTRKVIEKGVGSFGARPVHVVVTCRDLGRQLPAVWQEGVKNGDTVTYSDFLTDNLDAWEGVGTSDGMWRGQNLAGLVERWSRAVGADRVHVVTVPPAGAAHDVLWDRFRQAAGLPELDYAIPPKPRNTSLGAVETELVRRVVERMPEDVPWPVFARQVKRRLAQRRLAGHRAGGALSVPSQYQPQVQRVAADMVEALMARGCSWVGDPDDLRPQFTDGVSPAEVGTDQLLERALDVLVPLILDGADRPGREQARD